MIEFSRQRVVFDRDQEDVVPELAPVPDDDLIVCRDRHTVVDERLFADHHAPALARYQFDRDDGTDKALSPMMILTPPSIRIRPRSRTDSGTEARHAIWNWPLRSRPTNRGLDHAVRNFCNPSLIIMACRSPTVEVSLSHAWIEPNRYAVPAALVDRSTLS